MSAIDDLKNGVFIDATSETKSTPNTETNKNSIKITRSKQVVLPKDRKEPVPVKISTNENRKTVSVKDIMPKEEKEDPNIHESIEKDLLNLQDPNSPFMQYAKRLEKEEKEWETEVAEQKALADEEEELNESIKDSEEEADENIDDDFEEENDSDEIIEEDLSDSDELDILSDLDFMNDDIEEENDSDDEEVYDVEEDETDSVLEDVEISTDDTIEEEIEDEDDVETPNIDIGTDEVSTETNYDDESVESEQVTASDKSEEEVLNQLRTLATEKLKPASMRMDISSFTIMKKPINNVTPIFKSQKSKVSKWVLPVQEVIVKMKEFSGSDLEKLREYSDGSNADSLDALNRRFHLIYDHIVSPKPQAFNNWLKSTPVDDVDHFYFAIYIASYNGANYLPQDCINDTCKETFISDDIPIMDMVKFKTDEDKEKFMKIYSSETVIANTEGAFATELVPVSDSLAIGFKKPSIYNAFELSAIDQRVRDKYSSLINYIPYIDQLYYIDAVNNSLVPIGYKMYQNDIRKTVESKLQKYSKILNTLTTDEFAPIINYTRELSVPYTGLHYVYPGVNCPKCGTKTNDMDARAEELVFTRYQLGALVNTSLS